MGTSAELPGEIGVKGDHAHRVAVFLPEEHHGPGFFCFFYRQVALFFQGDIGADFLVDHLLDLEEFRFAYFLEVGKVKAHALFVYILPFLKGMCAQDAVQGRVHEVCGRVVARGSPALARVHIGAYGRFEMVGEFFQDVDNQVVFFLCIQDGDAFLAEPEDPGIAGLSAAFRIERRLVQHDLVLVFFFDFDRSVFQYFGMGGIELVVADEAHFAFVERGPVAHFFLGGGAGALFLCL